MNLNLTIKQKLILVFIAIPIMIFFGGLLGIFDTWFVHTKTVQLEMNHDYGEFVNKLAFSSKDIQNAFNQIMHAQTKEELAKAQKTIDGAQLFLNFDYSHLNENGLEQAKVSELQELRNSISKDLILELDSLKLQRNSQIDSKKIQEMDSQNFISKKSQIDQKISNMQQEAAARVQKTKEEASSIFTFGWYQLIGMIAFAMFFTGVIGIYFATKTISPLKKLENKARVIASGDLSADVDKDLLSKQDEIGNLSNSIQQIQTNFRLTISKMIDAVGTTSKNSENLMVSTQELRMGTTQVQAVINGISKGNEDLSASAQNTQEQTNKLLAILTQVNNSIKQSANSTNDVNEVAKKGSDAAMVAQDKIAAIKDTVDLTTNAINELGRKSKEINKVVEVINGISEQTNLLALNAAIEAARAGEAGRGFAVVADEVRKLAEESKKATMQIEAMVYEIINSTDAAVTSMNRGKQEVEESSEIIDNALFSLKIITDKIDAVAKQVDDISGSTKDQLSSSMAVQNSIAQVTNVAKENMAGAKHVSDSVTEITGAIRQINDISMVLVKNSEDLKYAIRDFKIK